MKSLNHTVYLFFLFMKNLHTVFHSYPPNLHSHQQYMNTFVHFCQRHLFLILLIVAILTVVVWYLIMVLLCIFLMIHDAEHFPMCLLSIFLSYLEKCLFRFSPHFFLLDFFLLLLFIYMWSLYILDANTLFGNGIYKYLLHFVDYFLSNSETFE